VNAEAGGNPDTRNKDRTSIMSDTMRYNFRMNIDGEDSFEVYRFGFDPAGFHERSSVEGLANSDSLNVSRFGLQVLCSMIEAQKTMLFTKPSDLVTVRLVETFLQNKTLDHISFVAIETANEAKTTSWVAVLNLKDVSIAGLKTRQQVGVLPNGQRLLVDVVSLRAGEAAERDYDSHSRPELKLEELRRLNNEPY
jgi:type VI protein secretion system component Hcp